MFVLYCIQATECTCFKRLGIYYDHMLTLIVPAEDYSKTQNLTYTLDTFNGSILVWTISKGGYNLLSIVSVFVTDMIHKI